MIDYIVEYSVASASTFIDVLVKGLVGFLLLVLYVVIGWLLLKLTVYLFKKILRFLHIEKLQEVFDKNELFGKLSVEMRIERIVISFIKIFVILLLVVVGAELFGLEIVSREVGNFVSYMPKLFIALAMLVAGVYFASWLKKTIVGVLKAIDFSGARFVGALVFYIVFVFVGITALNQAGINTDVITSNISIVVGAIMLVIVLSLGLGSKDMVARLLNSFYTRKNIEIGKRIKINNELEGYVIAIDNVYLCLLVDGKKNFIPINKISDSQIEILD